jgi:hypothetical protein
MATGKSVQRSVRTPEKPLLPPSELPDLDRMVLDFAARLRSEFTAEIGRDARGFKRHVVRLLAAALSPGPGRPRSKVVTLAIELRAQGKPWQVIYSQCISSSIAGDSRQVEQSRLRCAVRSRRIALKRRKSTENTLPNKI